jgi:hypothetical protein
MQEQGLLAQYEQQQRKVAQGVEQKERAASNSSTTPVPNKPFFDDPNYKSIFDRDRDRAQKDEQKQYQRASEDRLAEIEAKAAQKDARKTLRAESDAQMAELRARDQIQDLERQVREAKRDKMYEYNKASSERGNSAAEQVGQSYDSKIHDLEGKINDARNEH